MQAYVKYYSLKKRNNKSLTIDVALSMVGEKVLVLMVSIKAANVWLSQCGFHRLLFKIFGINPPREKPWGVLLGKQEEFWR